VLNDPTGPKRRIKALNDLLASRGWAILKEVMDEEIVKAALTIAENNRMTLDEINFRRGSIWAAKQLLDLPAKVKAIAENDLALATLSSATAEQKE
jgi:hypothetical protein